MPTITIDNTSPLPSATRLRYDANVEELRALAAAHIADPAIRQLVTLHLERLDERLLQLEKFLYQPRRPPTP